MPTANTPSGNGVRETPTSEPPQSSMNGGVFGRFYKDLRALAAYQLSSERVDHTLQPTALVHEAYIRLSSQSNTVNLERVKFLSVASEMIRRILVDHARHRNAAKRSGKHHRFPLESIQMDEFGGEPVDMLDLDVALERLVKLAPRQARVVELRFFAGLSVVETAKALGVSEGTVKGDWRIARAWLRVQLAR